MKITNEVNRSDVNTMHINGNIYKKFKRRMFIMAIFIAVFVSVSVPLTYFLTSLQDYKMKAKCLSEEVSERVVKIIKKDPELWRYSATKLIQVFDENESKKILIIRVYDSNKQLIKEEKYPKNNFFSCRGKINIVYNNVTFGYVELWISTGYLLYNSGILFLIVIILSSILSFVLFRFHEKIIEKAEMDIYKNTARLNQLSYFDHVTNLRNRTFLSEIFPSLISASDSFTLVFLDLDNFKHINDFYGHSYGDMFLFEVSKRLKELIRSDDIIIRFGGDEFIIIFLNFTSRQNIDKKLKSIIRSFSNPIYLNEMSLFATASIGVTIFPDDGEDLTHLLRNADIAMYTAKRNGRNNYCFYSDKMRTDSFGNLSLVNDMHQAIENKEFVLYYQPKFDIQTGDIVGCEILLRWLHPTLGLISPGRFIPLAEDNGLIVHIGEWVIRESFKQIKKWYSNYSIKPMRFSINISPHQFHQESLIPYIKTELGINKLSPEYIELEITENIALQNIETVFDKLNEIKRIGLNISIDDFGKGYSALNYLKVFPIDAMKIDMQFIQGINKEKGNVAIISSMITLAHDLGVHVVAEGIETLEQLNVLREKKCDFGQGYIFSKPVPAEEFILLLTKKKNPGPLS